MKRIGLILAAGLLMMACNRNTPVTPTPIPPTPTTAPVTASTQVPATSTSAPTIEASAPAPAEVAPTNVPVIAVSQEGAIFSSPRFTYSVALPCCWLALPTPGTVIESALAEAEANLPMWGDLNDQVQEESNGAVLELVALLPDENDSTLPVAQMTISVLPATGLTLDNYLVATEAELMGIANTTVLSAVIESELGAGGFPATLIRYTAESALASNNQKDQTIAGLQVAFYGSTPDTLIVLTFTTTTDRFVALEPEFLHIVRTVTFNDPAL